MADDDAVALCVACRRGDTARVREMLDAGANVNCGNPKFYDEPPLHFAAIGAQVATMRLLLGAGADAHATSQFDGRNAIHYAARAGSAEAVELMLAAGVSPSVEDSAGTSPSVMAFGEGHTQLARSLIAREKEEEEKAAAARDTDKLIGKNGGRDDVAGVASALGLRHQSPLVRATALLALLIVLLQLPPFRDALTLIEIGADGLLRMVRGVSAKSDGESAT